MGRRSEPANIRASMKTWLGMLPRSARQSRLSIQSKRDASGLNLVMILSMPKQKSSDGP